MAYKNRASSLFPNRYILLYTSNTLGIITPMGQGRQYPHPVQPTFMISLKVCAASSTRIISSRVSDPGNA